MAETETCSSCLGKSEGNSTTCIQEQANKIYHGLALAPMVRASTTPLRTLALEYGADIVYTEELVDRSIANTIRQENAHFGTIDYVKDPSQLSKKAQRKLQREARACLILRLDAKREQGKVICQLGSGEPELALAAAKHVYQDFAAIDINVGCPKKFSVSGGMGSALLQDPDRAAKIISTLREHIPRPISCKIRLLPTVDQTVAFVDRMIQAGANAVAIHARQVGTDATIPADWETLKKVMGILSLKYPSFPFLLNGDFYDRKEIQELLKSTKASGVLLGRPALYNTSLFSCSKYLSFHSTSKTSSQSKNTPPERKFPTLVDKTVVIQTYLRHAARYDIHFKNPKYVVCEMMNNRRAPTTRVPYLPQDFPGGQTIAKTCNATSLEKIFQVWNVPWRGVGPKALGADGTAADRETSPCRNATTPTVMAQGEHRYEDSYFLKKRPAEQGSHGTSEQQTVKQDQQKNNLPSLPDTKRTKVSNTI